MAATTISERSRLALSSAFCSALMACAADDTGAPLAAIDLVDGRINTSVYVCAPAGGPPFEFTIRRGAAELALWLPAAFERPYLVLSEDYAGTEFTGIYREADVSVDLAGEAVGLRVGEQRFSDCRENRQRSVWEHAKLSGIDFRASGEDPAWFLEIREAMHLDFRSAADAATLRLAGDEFLRRTEAGGGTYRAIDDRIGLVVEIGAAVCEVADGLGLRGSTVLVRYRGQGFSGCGRPLH